MKNLIANLRYIERRATLIVFSVFASAVVIINVVNLSMGRPAPVTVPAGNLVRYGGEVVRLFGIDSPPPGVEGATEAREHLIRLVGGGRIPAHSCTRLGLPEPGVQAVATCHVAFKDLAIAQLHSGHAVVWCSDIRQRRPEMESVYRAASDEARLAKRGLWSRPFKPWRDWGCE